MLLLDVAIASLCGPKTARLIRNIRTATALVNWEKILVTSLNIRRTDIQGWTEFVSRIPRIDDLWQNDIQSIIAGSSRLQQGFFIMRKAVARATYSQDAQNTLSFVLSFEPIADAYHGTRSFTGIGPIRTKDQQLHLILPTSISTEIPRLSGGDHLPFQ